MPPFFSPPPHGFGNAPIYIAAVNPRMMQLAGKMCDGVFIHAYHTADYIKYSALPNIENGLASAGRSRADLKINTAVFAIPTDDPVFAAKAEAEARRQIAFYMSTPAYRVVTDLHGWGDLQYRLSRYARIGAWEKMASLLPDAVLDEIAIRGKWAELPALIAARYGSMIDGVSYYLPFVPGEADEGWKASIAGFKALSGP